MQIEPRPLADLIPYARNSRTHSETQVAQIAASIREFGFNNPVLIDPEGVVIAGHGRLLAAQALGLEEVPAIVLGHLSEAQRRAYVIADNQIALNAGWDFETLRAEIDSLGEDFDLGLLGFSDADLDSLGAEDPDPEPDGPVYSRKVEAPIYTPTGETPPVSALFNDTKARSLIEEIEGADVPPDVAQFLRHAAERHTVFNFHRIADFYAAAPAPVQRLMERSALVIVDVDQAIEGGFMRLVKDLGDLAVEDRGGL